MACMALLLDALHVLEIATGASIEACLDMLNVRGDAIIPIYMRNVVLRHRISTTSFGVM